MDPALTKIGKKCLVPEATKIFFIVKGKIIIIPIIKIIIMLIDIMIMLLFFLATPTACGSSQARDQTHPTAVT